MLPLLRLLLLTLPVGGALNDQITWGSVVYTYHGEKTPALADNGDKLSPLGAHQMLLAGQSIRARYILANTNVSSALAPITDLSQNSIDNTQLRISSTNDEWITAGATAFMGGLYPPRGLIVDDDTLLSNSTLVQYPWDGWQFANIGTLSSLDYNYIWLAGNENCALYDIATNQALNSAGYKAELNRTAAFYKSLSTTVFGQVIPGLVNYYNAYALYEYALYEYNHNRTTLETLSEGDLAYLQFLASEQQFELNTPTSIGTLPAISGATLATRVLQQLNRLIISAKKTPKLFINFGSYEPFLAFFALSNLSVGPAAPRFTSLPQHGSLMSFEVFSYNSNDASNPVFPNSTADLWVRFLFRNGSADDDEKLTAYPLFGRGNSETDMKWNDFTNAMNNLAIDGVGDWCASCQTPNLFCAGIASETQNDTIVIVPGSSGGYPGMKPAVAGVIGAVIAFILAGLAAGLLALLGFRMGKRENNNGGLGVLRRNGSGVVGGGKGFKGAEKLASDTDLRLKGAGATIIRHERVGSWELNDSPTGKHSSLDKQIEAGGPGWRRDSEDGIGNVNPFGDPVKAADQV